MNRCYINRGLPGSGKSYYTKKIQENFNDVVICSADDHFIQEDGSYQFNPYEIALAHQKCQFKFFDAISKGVETVVVDNTNVCLWEFTNYYQQAVFFGYRVIIVDLHPSTEQEARAMLERNSHGVPVELGLGMFKRWQVTPDRFYVIFPSTGF